MSLLLAVKHWVGKLQPRGHQLDRALLLYPFLSGCEQMPRSVLCRIAVIVICNDLVLKCQHQSARNSVSPQSQHVVAIHSWHLPTALAWCRPLTLNECKHATTANEIVFWYAGEPCLVRACCIVIFPPVMWFKSEANLNQNSVSRPSRAGSCPCNSAGSLVVWFCPQKQSHPEQAWSKPALSDSCTNATRAGASTSIPLWWKQHLNWLFS